MSARWTLLQLCPFSEYLTDRLAQHYEVVAWHAMPEAERDAWLAANGGQVRLVATGGHLGCANALMARLPNLALVAINGVGFDKVDLDFARARGVRVSTTPDVLTDDVADLAVGQIIALLRDLHGGDRFVRSGAWLNGDKPLARKVSGRRFGVVGLGGIGSAIARRLAAFGPVAYTGRRAKAVPHAFVPDLLDLARQSDALIVAAAATAENRGMIGAAALAALGAEGYLVNVARGSLVDEAALIAALESGTIAGAALDVFADEPRVPAELARLDNVLLTPHVASATVETRRAMADLVLANLDAVAAGDEPLTPVA
jgi:lactate dehydrogenase-like 2-hydroxyacid dehydrogenase